MCTASEIPDVESKSASSRYHHCHPLSLSSFFLGPSFTPSLFFIRSSIPTPLVVSVHLVDQIKASPGLCSDPSRSVQGVPFNTASSSTPHQSSLVAGTPKPFQSLRQLLLVPFDKTHGVPSPPRSVLKFVRTPPPFRAGPSTVLPVLDWVSATIPSSFTTH